MKRSTHYAGNRRSFRAVAATADWMRVGYECDMSASSHPGALCVNGGQVCVGILNGSCATGAPEGSCTRVGVVMSCAARVPCASGRFNGAAGEGGGCH